MSPEVLSGLVQASSLTTLVATAIGVLMGLIVGMIPGLTISTGIIILLPVTFVLLADISIALLLGLYVGGMTGGSFSAVLINIPGTPSASATALDGYPMAARGEAGRALGIAITASFVGGLFSFLCLYFIAPLLADVALLFRTQDMFALVFFGLTVICSFATKSLVKGLLSGVIGLAIVTIGQDPVMGTHRFTFGQVNLLGGIHFLTALIGLFAIPQLVSNLTYTAEGMPGGVMLQIGLHYVDVLMMLMGPVKRVSGMASQLVLPGDNPDVGTLLMTHENGAVSSLSTSYASASDYYLVNVYGKKMSAYYNFFDGLRCLKQGDGEQTPIAIEPTDTLAEELIEWADAVRGGQPPEVGGEGATDSLAVVLAGVKSVAEGRHVAVAELLEG